MHSLSRFVTRVATLTAFAANGAAGLAAQAAVKPVAHWPLSADARGADAATPAGRAESVTFGDGAARFDGRKSVIEIPATDLPAQGAGDFSVSVWVETQGNEKDTLGDIVSRQDPATGRGWQLGLLHTVGACTSMANTRNLFFGLSDGSDGGPWVDCGRPGNTVMAYALAVHDGALYAGTYEDPGQGHVYRWRGGTEWEDIGAPGPANAISALAVHDGHLYAASTRYNASGSHIQESQNQEIGGKVYRMENDGSWTDCGRAGPGEFIFTLLEFDGKLYASNMDSPDRNKISGQGLYRYDGGETWTYCGNPGGRVAAMSIHDGHIYGTGYDGEDVGGVFRYEGDSKWTNFGSPPEVTQTYSFAYYWGTMNVGVWPTGEVLRVEPKGSYTTLGQLGEEQEVMGIATYNGRLYGGTLPLAQVYRYDGGTDWSLTGRLDFTDTEYRRAFAMAVFDGKLFCSALPSGKIFSFSQGQAATVDRAMEPGRHMVTAVRQGPTLRIYVDGRKAGESTAEAAIDATSDAPLRIGFGAHDYFNGALSDLRLYDKALSDEEAAALHREAARP